MYVFGVRVSSARYLLTKRKNKHNLEIYFLSGSDFFPYEDEESRGREKKSERDMLTSANAYRDMHLINYCAHRVSCWSVSAGNHKETHALSPLFSCALSDTLIALATSSSLATNHNAHFKRARRRGLMEKDIFGLRQVTKISSGQIRRDDPRLCLPCAPLYAPSVIFEDI